MALGRTAAFLSRGKAKSGDWLHTVAEATTSGAFAITPTSTANTRTACTQLQKHHSAPKNPVRWHWLGTFGLAVNKKLATRTTQRLLRVQQKFRCSTYRLGAVASFILHVVPSLRVNVHTLPCFIPALQPHPIRLIVGGHSAGLNVQHGFYRNRESELCIR